MRILFDHNVPKRFRRSLPVYEVRTTREMRWERLANGLLISAAAGNGFEAFLSIDKNIQYEQNLNRLPLPIIVLDCLSNALPGLIPFAPFVLDLCGKPLDCRLYIIKPHGEVICLGQP